jgi:hypothetical protein
MIYSLATTSGLQIGISLIGLALTILIAAALISVFRGTRVKNLTDLQAGAVASLQGELDAQKARGDRLEAENRLQAQQLAGQQRQIDAQGTEIAILREQVTQVAKVDELTKKVEVGFEQVLERLPRQAMTT